MKETKQYQTESKQLLNLMINSIYTNKEIFLRELISNASDAIDKEKYLSLTSAGKIPSRDYEIFISVDSKARSLTISDNGVGMDHDELVNNLGTIARSGSKEFAEKLKKAKSKEDVDIIGQFGVGFYSAFMVASSIEVLTKKDDGKAYLFSSSGEDGYSIEESEKKEAGTSITVYLKKDEKEEDYSKYLDSYTIRELIKKYSDYVRYPIKMSMKESKPDLDKDGKPIKDKYHDEDVIKTLNSMLPIWKKNEKDVSEDELKEFYKGKFSDYEDPMDHMFLKIDGIISYNALLFVPSHLPMNYYSENYEPGLQLYAKGVFIKDKCQELVPPYLKFLKGLVDSEDFSLNISREMLQDSPLLRRISDNIEKKFIAHLKDMQKNDPKKYLEFYQVYGEQLKYGIYSTYGANKDLLVDTLMFHSLKLDKLVSLREYKDAMPKTQKSIFYAVGDKLDSIKLLPELESYKKDGVDVLLFDQKIDEFAIMMLGDFDKVKFVNIGTQQTDELPKETKDKLDSLRSDNKRILDDIKESLKGKVDDVDFSSKLVDSPVCISTKEGVSLGMEKTLSEQPGAETQGEAKASKVLEINPDHTLFKAISSLSDDESIKRYGSLLYEEAMLLEGYEISDKKEFVSQLNQLMEEALKK